MEIKYKDIKDFLEELGYDWNNVLMVSNCNQLTLAKKLQNLDDTLSLMYTFTEPRFAYISKDKHLRAEAGLTHFTIFSKDEKGGFSSGKSFDNLWVEFLLKRYKKQYADEVKKVYNTIKTNLLDEYDKSLIKIAIERHRIENNTEKAYLKTKEKNLTVEERSSAMSDYQAKTAFMISSSARFADEISGLKRELARKLCGFEEIKEQISRFGY